MRGRIEHVGFLKGRLDPVYTGLRDKFNELAERKLPVSTPPPDPWLDQIIDAVWVIESTDATAFEEASQGTAFFVRDVGLVTCAHCVNKSGRMIVYNPKYPNRKHEVGLERSNAALDSAILSHSIPSAEHTDIAVSERSDAKRGEQVTVVGWPNFAPGSELTTRNGHVDSFRIKAGVRRVCVSCGIVSGNSGGPVFDADRRLVGVAVTGADSVLEAMRTDENAYIPIEALNLLST